MVYALKWKSSFFITTTVVVPCGTRKLSYIYIFNKKVIFGIFILSVPFTIGSSQVAVLGLIGFPCIVNNTSLFVSSTSIQGPYECTYVFCQ
jgi:hypothetical protein